MYEGKGDAFQTLRFSPLSALTLLCLFLICKIGIFSPLMILVNEALNSVQLQILQKLHVH